MILILEEGVIIALLLILSVTLGVRAYDSIKAKKLISYKGIKKIEEPTHQIVDATNSEIIDIQPLLPVD